MAMRSEHIAFMLNVRASRMSGICSIPSTILIQ